MASCDLAQSDGPAQHNGAPNAVRGSLLEAACELASPIDTLRHQVQRAQSAQAGGKPSASIWIWSAQRSVLCTRCEAAQQAATTSAAW